MDWSAVGAGHRVRLRPVCIYCQSHEVQIGTEKRGYNSVGGLVGMAYLGPLGLGAGLIGSGKMQVSLTCHRCLKVFDADTLQKYDTKQWELAAQDNVDVGLQAGFVSTVFVGIVAVVLYGLTNISLDGMFYWFGGLSLAIGGCLYSGVIKGRQVIREQIQSRIG
jgi:hypothetical protein